LCRKLQVATIKPVKITAPALNVTGMVAASLRPGNRKGSDYWQFNSSELLTAFTDWQKATADITFAETQLAQIRQLADTRVTAQQKLVERMKKLVEAGTDTQKDLAAAEADLIQAQIQGRKEVHEAETAGRLARRSEAALARQLQQAGLDSELLQSAASDLDIVMADVPEGLMSRVKIGQGCEARFFGFPDQVFSGKVRALAPVLSKERRSLRVLFAISDPQDQLRPGMFADIGLGTDARDALLVAPEGVVHVGRSDYVLVRNGSGDWRVTEVQVGELHETGLEIVGGLRAGDQVAGQGVILLKPYIIQSLQTHPWTQALQTQTHSTPEGGRL
jgi:RND family efflux transporter MFP subunit